MDSKNRHRINLNDSIHSHWSPKTWDPISNTYLILDKHATWSPKTWDSVSNTYLIDVRNESCLVTWDSSNNQKDIGKLAYNEFESTGIIICDVESFSNPNLDDFSNGLEFDSRKMEREFFHDLYS